MWRITEKFEARFGSLQGHRLDYNLTLDLRVKWFGRERGMLDVVLSGQAFAEEDKTQWRNYVPAKCKCGAVQTKRHLWHECPLHAAERTVSRKGWYRDRAQSLQDIPLPTFSPEKTMLDIEKSRLVPSIPQQCTSFLDVTYKLAALGLWLFTDGSAYPANLPEVRTASWAVWSQEHGRLLASGYLPGRNHTINRAELFAVIQALRITLCLTIFTDSSYVVDAVREAPHRRREGNYHKIKNGDLLLQLDTLLGSRPSQSVLVRPCAEG